MDPSKHVLNLSSLIAECYTEHVTFRHVFSSSLAMVHLERITEAVSQGRGVNRVVWRVEGKKNKKTARLICTMRGANEQSYVNGGASVTHASVNEQMRCMILKKITWF